MSKKKRCKTDIKISNTIKKANNFRRQFKISFVLQSFLYILISTDTATQDISSLNKYRLPILIKFPWTADIHQFHYYRATGAIISDRHILATASNILPYRGSPVETKDNGDSIEKHFWYICFFSFLLSQIGADLVHVKTE